MLCRRVLPALILALSVLLTACPSENTRPDEYYCAPGYHLVTGGACVLDEAQADGDRPDSAEPDAEWHDQERWESPETREAEAELTEAEAEREAESEDVAETDTATPDGDERDADPVADDESDADSTDAADGDEDARDADESVAPESDGAEPEAEEAPPTYCLTLKAPTVLAVGGVSRLESTLAFCDGSKKIDDYTLTPTPYDHTLLDVSATTDASPSYTLKGIAVGEPTLQAEARIGTKVVATESVKLRIVARQRVEARGLWVNRWAFAGDKTQGQKDIAQIMDNAKNAHFNQIYFQVRGTFDAYYDSNYEPWAARLSGTLGKDPGWDPLAVAISEAHNRGLELHAWINVFTIWASTTAPSDNEHALVKYPGWVMCDASGQAMTTLVDSYIWASPGNSWVRAHNTAVVADIATRYDVDGIHLDRVRYPGTAYSHDAASESAYATAKETRPALSFADWEREQVVAQVAEMYAALTDKAPRVALSAAGDRYLQRRLGLGVGLARLLRFLARFACL